MYFVCHMTPHKHSVEMSWSFFQHVVILIIDILIFEMNIKKKCSIENMNLIKICTTTEKFSSLDEIVPAWVPIPPIKPERSNFFSPPPPPPPPPLFRQWKTYQFPPGRQNSPIIPTCCICLIITLLPISEQLTNVLIPSYVIQVV